MAIELKEHQKRVVRRIQEPGRHGLLVYHGLGSGKTLTAIAAAKALKTSPSAPPATVVTPASLQDNFKKEIKKSNGNQKDFNVTSYGKHKSTPTNTLIVDEAHKIRNSDTKRHTNIASTPSKKTLLLTATPIQNKPHEISTLINRVAGDPHRLPTSEAAFNKKYIRKTEHNPNIFNYIFKGERSYTTRSPKNLETFRKKTKGLVDYHKNSTEGFPSSTRTVHKIEMNKRQKELSKLYRGKLSRKARTALRKSVSPDRPESTKQMNAFLSQTRQLANRGPKIKAIAKNIASTPSTNSALVYSNYLRRGVLPLSKRLTKLNISHGIYTGELSQKAKSDLVKKYNNKKIKALLVSSAGGEGLDLKETNSVHIMEPHWNNPKIKQVIGRAIRYKSHKDPSKSTVNVHRYLADNSDTKTPTADEYLSEMSRKKRKLNNAFLDVLKKP